MAERPKSADELRRAFVEFFEARGHVAVPSASVIPVDQTLLFTVAGMVPFKGYFTGDETPPYPRAVSVQKCVRAGGKHNDLDDIGRTNRHFSFFEMLGNFSFGDYFKAEAIRFAWDFYTQVLQVDTEPSVGHRPRGRRRGRAHLARRDRASRPTASSASARTTSGAWATPDRAARRPRSSGTSGRNTVPTVGPITESDRYIEIWNLVFMTYDQLADGTRVPLPKPSIDTGAGPRAQPHGRRSRRHSIWDIDVFQPLLAAAAAVDRRARTAPPSSSDISLRILAEHARTMTFMIERRRPAVEPGARLRAAPHHPPRGPPCVPARRARSRDCPRWSTRRSK